MKHTLTLLSLLLIFACKTESGERNAVQSTQEKKTETTSLLPAYPQELSAVLDAHGGLETWKNQRTLIYDIPKGESTETHTIDLRRRLDRIDTEAFSMGYDGQGTWILDPGGVYEGNPEFYHNLMFYFYAMPFVLADPGIQYSVTPDLEFDGRSYPGLRISYGSGIGTSPEDEYFIHYDPESYQMVWLGYTVTYRSGERSDNVKWIRYDDWETFNGLVLPRSISWYTYEGRTIKELRNTVRFENIRLSEHATERQRFEKPKGAEYVTPKASS